MVQGLLSQGARDRQTGRGTFELHQGQDCQAHTGCQVHQVSGMTLQGPGNKVVQEEKARGQPRKCLHACLCAYLVMNPKIRPWTHLAIILQLLCDVMAAHQGRHAWENRR